jgi:hypothetical protein
VVEPHAQEVDAAEVAAQRAPRAAPLLARLHGQAHVLAHGEMREQLRELERAPEPAPRAVRRRHGGDVLASQQHAALAGLQLPGDEVEIGRLARAVGPDDGSERAGQERARNVVDGHVAAEADGEVAGFEHGRAGAGAGGARSAPRLRLIAPISACS